MRTTFLRTGLEASSFLQDMAPEEQANALNGSLVDASPHVHVFEDGNLERRYPCHNLLTAMYLMFYLDLTGGSTIKNRQSSGCPEFFEPEPNVTANITLSAVPDELLLAERAA